METGIVAGARFDGSVLGCGLVCAAWVVRTRSDVGLGRNVVGMCGARMPRSVENTQEPPGRKAKQQLSTSKLRSNEAMLS